MIILHVNYFCKPGCRESFMKAVMDNGIDEGSRNEPGNIKYEYSYSVSDENVLVLTEVWKDHEAVKIHGSMPHFKLLGELKDRYVEKAEIKRFEAEEFTV